MRLIIVLATLAIAWPFIISGTAMPFGNAVSERFLERPTRKEAPSYTIPRQTAAGQPLDKTSLAKWVRENSESANGYATRVIPLDLVYLALLGGFLAIASMTLAGFVRWPKELLALPALVWLLLPVVYVASDVVEDGLIFMMLHWPFTIDDLTVNTLAFVRTSKIVTVTFSIIQVLLLCTVSFVLPSRSAE